MTSEQESEVARATAVFEAEVGTWEAEVDIRMDPAGPPVRQHGTQTNRRIGGGRWLLVDYRSDSGFEGHGVYGWDVATKKYTGVWVDSMQASIARSTGAWDKAARRMTYETATVHQGKDVRYRETIDYRSDGTRLYRNLLTQPDGSELELIRTVYRRRA